jgi:2-polyprenyl-3-methyl-5-hydroxy-6-metoxy-1,4-benzoquinol methylase
MSTYTRARCAERWNAALAPRTGDAGQEIILEVAEYLGMPLEAVRSSMDDATTAFTEEWRTLVGERADEQSITRFYNESQTELFDLAKWHADDVIHYRTLVCCDIASGRPGRRYLDYGSGIGSDALIFAAAGFEVTLADVSEPLLAFAKWRFERRGIPVNTIDLKQERPRTGLYDAALCFDVLEHIPQPLRTVRQIHDALRADGLLFLHAPFGVDPDRPMHVVHEDVVTSRMPTIGFDRRSDLEAAFPDWLWAPRVYDWRHVPALDRLAYHVRDQWLTGPVGTVLGRVYKRLIPGRRRTVAA